jgi:hypothetical protein
VEERASSHERRPRPWIGANKNFSSVRNARSKCLSPERTEDAAVPKRPKMPQSRRDGRCRSPEATEDAAVPKGRNRIARHGSAGTSNQQGPESRQGRHMPELQRKSEMPQSRRDGIGKPGTPVPGQAINEGPTPGATEDAAVPKGRT